MVKSFPKDKDKPKTRRSPVTYTDEMLNEIFDLMDEGTTYSKACEEVGVHKGPMWAFINKCDKRKERYAQSRMVQMSYTGSNLESLIEEIPDYGPDGKIDGGWVAYQRLKVDTLKFLLAKVIPRVYGDKIEVDNKGELGLNVTIKHYADADNNNQE
jgi:hypothetical protein